MFEDRLILPFLRIVGKVACDGLHGGAKLISRSVVSLHVVKRVYGDETC